MRISKETFQDLIQMEREDQYEKWGSQDHSDEKWLAILLEELGEAAEAVLDENDEVLLIEVVQIAAVLQAWVTSRDFGDSHLIEKLVRGLKR